MRRCCKNCKHLSKYLYADGSNSCRRNGFKIEWISHSVCEYFEESGTIKRKRECGFRKIK